MASQDYRSPITQVDDYPPEENPEALAEGQEERRERRKKKKKHREDTGEEGEERRPRRHKKKHRRQLEGEEAPAPEENVEPTEGAYPQDYPDYQPEGQPPPDALNNPVYQLEAQDQPEYPEYYPDDYTRENGNMAYPEESGGYPEDSYPSLGRTGYPEDSPYRGDQPPVMEPINDPYNGPEGNGTDDFYLQRPEGEVPVEKEKKKKGGGLFGKIFSRGSKKRSSVTSDQGDRPESSSSIPWSPHPNEYNPAIDTLPYQEPITAAEPPPTRKSKKATPSAPRGPKTRARVILLDGGEVAVELDKRATGQILMSNICKGLEIVEMDYFGMTWVNRKVQTWFWLEMEKKIAKQLTHGEDWTFNFQCRFYPPEPSFLQEDITRYQVSLQIRQDIYTGKLPCSWITQALLGSYLVQSELGDYEPDEHGTDLEYLREFEFVHAQDDKLLTKIAEVHRSHKGMTPADADLKYLETAKRLEQYGVDLHPARDIEDVEIYIGVCYQGIVVYRGGLRIGRFVWPKVLRISYRKNFFYLKIRSDFHDDIDATVGFKLHSAQAAKRLWKMAIEHHSFFRLKDPGISARQAILTMPSFGSKYRYSGHTLHQYRSMTIDRPKPQFDRTLTKRRTCSLPMGLNTGGFQYSSMHSLNRAHPRDMTLGRTQSVEYTGPRRYGSESTPLNEPPSSAAFFPPPARGPGSVTSSVRGPGSVTSSVRGGGGSVVSTGSKNPSERPLAPRVNVESTVRGPKAYREPRPQIADTEKVAARLAAEEDRFSLDEGEAPSPPREPSPQLAPGPQRPSRPAPPPRPQPPPRPVPVN